MKKFEKLKSIISSIEADAKKFYDGGNGAAGTRVRKAMQELKSLAQEIRTDVTELKNKDK
ncbi:MAG: histone H1 [Pedobacter sp.]